MSLSPQVAVITGASSGIGYGIAKALASTGCHVGLLARREAQLAELASEIEQSGGKSAIAAADVTDRTQTVKAIHSLREQLGPIDLLVANAGVGKPDRIDPFSVDDIEQMIRVNLLGVVYAIEAVLPEMLARGQGHLAAVSSQGAYKGMPGSAGYCASKAGLSTLMEGLRIELRSRGIRMTTICPGFVRTPMTADNRFFMPGLMDADEAGRHIVRALARGKKVYNFPWQTTLLMKLVRWMPDWMLARTLPRKDGGTSTQELAR